MRWLVIILLMCNGIYFLWQYYLVPAATGREAAASQRLELGQQLQLISELPAEEVAATREAAVAVAEEASAPVVEEPAVCLMIGPFKEEVTGKQVVSRLAALDIYPKITSISVSGKPNYWVHIPPMTSRKVAIKLLRELQSKNIDSFLITEGELENGISLGIFSRLESAESVVSERAGQGYDAQVLILPSVRKEQWAIFDEEQTEKFSDALWGSIQGDESGLQRRKNYCDKIAPSHDFD